MGIIVLAVAIIPLLGIGGTQLYRAESSGPLKDQKSLPKISEVAKALWIIYASLTVLCAIAYWLSGMNLLMPLGIVVFNNFKWRIFNARCKYWLF